jgi:hypothetical protein
MQSFDLCDNALGVGVSETLNDPDMLARFGHGDGVRGPDTVESKLAERFGKKPNGSQAVVEKANGSETVAKTEVV